ncbi:MAG: hypothetical protein HYZ73_04570 [Elusimicrobia bacterium]|nr:hypothetical protein [Elusimicrobiota bacterium]
MGEAFVAVADTADAPYWNPAGLNRIPHNLFTIMLEGARQSPIPVDQVISGQPLQGRKLTYLAFAGRQGAISYRPLANQRERVTLLVANPNANFKETNVQVNAFTASAAWEGGGQQPDRSLVGFNLTYLNGHASLTQLKEGESPTAIASIGHGIALDLGILMTLASGLEFGLVGQNIPGYLWWDEFARDRLPPVLKSGLAVQFPAPGTLTFDYEKRFYTVGDRQPDLLHLGTEVWLWNVVAVRAGISGENWNDSNKVRYTGGIGVKRGVSSLDVGMRKFQLSTGKQANAVYEYERP